MDAMRGVRALEERDAGAADGQLSLDEGEGEAEDKQRDDGEGEAKGRRLDYEQEAEMMLKEWNRSRRCERNLNN